MHLGRTVAVTMADNRCRMWADSCDGAMIGPIRSYDAIVADGGSDNLESASGRDAQPEPSMRWLVARGRQYRPERRQC